MPNNKTDMGLAGAGNLLQAEESELGCGNEANPPRCTRRGACKPAPPRGVLGLCLLQTYILVFCGEPGVEGKVVQSAAKTLTNDVTLNKYNASILIKVSQWLSRKASSTKTWLPSHPSSSVGCVHCFYQLRSMF